MFRVLKALIVSVKHDLRCKAQRDELKKLEGSRAFLKSGTIVTIEEPSFSRINAVFVRESSDEKAYLVDLSELDGIDVESIDISDLDID